MKNRLIRAATVLAVSAVSIWAVALPEQKLSPAIPHISLRSNPYPLVIGSSTLSVVVTDSVGNPVKNAQVSLTANMSHEGMLPLTARPVGYQNGAYPFSITWAMNGTWIIDITAELPGQMGYIQDQFEVYVYPVAQDVAERAVQFHSLSDNFTLIDDPETEYGIIIPQGTGVLMREGQSPDVIPTEIRLRVSAQHTLVIQNNDLVDHTIGPFTVRAGEVIRQTFMRPSVYQGTCSLNVAAEMNIIVEE